jgi:ATP-dependent helicase HepA
MVLEAVYVLEPVAPPHLHTDRFLPPIPIKLAVTHKLEDISAVFRDAALERKLQKGSGYKLIENPEIARRTLPAMLEAATGLAEKRAVDLRRSALAEMNQLLDREVQRLQMLIRVNNYIRPQEIETAKAQKFELSTAIEQSRTRLDSLRLIWNGSSEVVS